MLSQQRIIGCSLKQISHEWGSQGENKQVFTNTEKELKSDFRGTEQKNKLKIIRLFCVSGIKIFKSSSLNISLWITAYGVCNPVRRINYCSLYSVSQITVHQIIKKIT